tara:strand:+ start:168189 stop:170024 length:1836 start_codon:yes stop_codon:yes gene_type:complete
MPFTKPTIRCRSNAEIDSALFDFQEKLGDILVETRAEIAALSATAEAVESDFSAALKLSMDRVLAIVNTSTDDILSASGVVAGADDTALETSLMSAYGLNVVNGRIIPPGDTDLGPVARLANLAGGIESLMDAVPTLGELPLIEGPSRDYVPFDLFAPFFVMVPTYLKVSLTEATSCSPEVRVEERITLGFDRSIESAAASVGISEDDVEIYVFWLGEPTVSTSNRAKAVRLGLTNAEFAASLAGRSTGRMTVEVIRDPRDIIRALTVLGDDADDFLAREPGKVTLTSGTTAIVDSIHDSLTPAVGAKTSAGVKSYSSPALALFSTMDISRTFQYGIKAELLSGRAASETGEVEEFIEGAAASIMSALQVVDQLVKEIQQAIAPVLTNLTNVQSVLNLVFENVDSGVMDCLFGSGFSPLSSLGTVSGSVPGIGGIGGPGSPGTPGVSTADLVDGIISVVEAQSNTVTGYIQRVRGLVSNVGAASCMGSFLSSAASGQYPDVPGLGQECQGAILEDEGFDMPLELSVSLESFQNILEVVTAVVEAVGETLRRLRMAIKSTARSLRTQLLQRRSSTSLAFSTGSSASEGCAPSQVTQLARLLQLRAVAGFIPS